MTASLVPRTSPSDAELLDAWARGCRAAGNRLIERHVADVYRYFRYRVGANHLQDLAQETFLSALEARARYERRVPFKHYLFGIARYRLFAFLRNEGRTELGVADVHDPSASPAEALSWQSEARGLLEALLSLPIEQQLILQRAYWQSMTGPELAGALEVPLNTAYAQLRRAKLALRAAIDRQPPKRGHVRDCSREFDAWAERLCSAE